MQEHALAILICAFLALQVLEERQLVMLTAHNVVVVSKVAQIMNMLQKVQQEETEEKAEMVVMVV
jgi:hypothetical protein